MGYKSPRTFTIPINGRTALSPADGSTYYVGSICEQPTASADARRMYTPISGTIRQVNLFFYATTNAGSNENITAYIRKNNTTDTTIAVVGTTDVWRLFNNQNMNIPISTTDYFEIKILFPTWADNPTGFYFYGYVVIEYE